MRTQGRRTTKTTAINKRILEHMTETPRSLEVVLRFPTRQDDPPALRMQQNCNHGSTGLKSGSASRWGREGGHRHTCNGTQLETIAPNLHSQRALPAALWKSSSWAPCVFTNKIEKQVHLGIWEPAQNLRLPTEYGRPGPLPGPPPPGRTGPRIK